MYSTVYRHVVDMYETWFKDDPSAATLKTSFTKGVGMRSLEGRRSPVLGMASTCDAREMRTCFAVSVGESSSSSVEM